MVLITAALIIFFTLMAIVYVANDKSLVGLKEIKKEFQSYNLPKMFRDLVGILKISFTVMLQFENNNLIMVGSLGIVVLMLGAVATHVRMKNPVRDMLPAITMLSIGLIILLYTVGQTA